MRLNSAGVRSLSSVNPTGVVCHAANVSLVVARSRMGSQNMMFAGSGLFTSTRATSGSRTFSCDGMHRGYSPAKGTTLVTTRATRECSVREVPKMLT